MKSARDYGWFTTRKYTENDCAVVLTGRRAQLTPNARKYVEAGERERWHEAESFVAAVEKGDEWYWLRDAEIAPILFPKTMQYSPFVLYNDAKLLANQRLYRIKPKDGLNAQVLCAILNSTLFAAERYSAVKSLGREAAIDVEVFTAKSFRIPDIRSLSKDEATELRDSMRRLLKRKVGKLLEESIASLGHDAAVAFAMHNPVNAGSWSDEINDPDRAVIDRISLRCIGVSEGKIEETRVAICNELVAHVRQLRIVELEAQQNRQGTSNSSAPAARQLADEIWADILNSETIEIRTLPVAFLDGVGTKNIYIPSGRVRRVERSLFDAEPRFACKIGAETLEFASLEQLNYVMFLGENGVSGEVPIPEQHKDCSSVLEEMKTYAATVSELVQKRAEQITADEDRQRKIVREALRAIARH